MHSSQSSSASLIKIVLCKNFTIKINFFYLNNAESTRIELILLLPKNDVFPLNYNSLYIYIYYVIFIYYILYLLFLLLIVNSYFYIILYYLILFVDELFEVLVWNKSKKKNKNKNKNKNNNNHNNPGH